jgi:TolA-binding protein
MDQDKNRADFQVMLQDEKARAEHLKQMQEKEQIAVKRRALQEKEASRLAQQKQEAELSQLASKAADINEDIIRLSKEQNYEAMKVKFDELEKTVSALTTLKEAIAQQKDHGRRQEQFDQQELRRQNALIARKKQMDLHSHVPAVALPHLTENADQYKHREIVREQDGLFHEAVDCYKHRKYTQARLLFGELDDQRDRRAEPWLKKVDKAISVEVLRSKEAEERERTAFIAEQIRAQHKLAIIQERERKRQKELTEEWDRQKRLYEQNNVLERQKEATLKAEDQERQHQEELRRKADKEDQKQQITYRFHKVQNLPAAQKEKVGTDTTFPKKVVSVPTFSKAVREESLSQDQLSVRKDAIRKELEDGVDAMYQEALRLYKQGQYTQAADKFKDVQDIIPNYKSSGQYIDASRQKATVSKALDLLDPNVK